jgi:hypothetical protein
LSIKNYLLKNKGKIIRNCFFFSFMMAASLAGYLMAVKTGAVLPPDVQEEPMPAAANEQRTEEGCIVSWEFIYETCGHTVKAKSEASADMTGLTLKEFQSKFKNIKVLDFSPKAITLQKRIEQYCPNHMILKSYDNVLGVFKPELGSDELSLVKRLAIPPSEVPENLKTALYYGAVFNSMDEVEAFVSKKIEQK